MSFGDTSPQSQPFQVNLQAVVELLSRNIYSHPSVYLRELIQNARDAVIARVEGSTLDLEDGRIFITPTGPEQLELVVRDNGIGMMREEMASLLATVGHSSKRDILDLPRTDRLGQFGIGLLSCFMIADDIVVETRPMAGGAPSRWVGHADGTFDLTQLSGEEADAIPVGTTVRLKPREENRDLTTYARVWKLACQFAEFLPVQVEVLGPRGTERYVNRMPFFSYGLSSSVSHGVMTRGNPNDELLAFTESDEMERILAFGEELVGATPLAAIRLEIPETGTMGTAFVLPSAPSPGNRQTARAYLGGLLVGKAVPDLLPDWAFFVKVVLDSTGLTPTASREGFVADESLAFTKRAIAGQLRAWIVELTEHDKVGLQRFLAVHDLPLRSLAMHDVELASMILPHLTFETSQGRMVMSEIVERNPRVRYAATTEEFRQMAGVLTKDQLLVNAGYVYEAELMQMLPEAMENVTAERMRIQDVIAEFTMVPRSFDAQVDALTALGNEALFGLDCDVQVRAFSPTDVPALYVVDPLVLRTMELRRLEESTGGFWGELMSEFVDAQAEAGVGPDGDPDPGDAPFATLVLNWSSPLIQTLVNSDDDVVVSRTLRLLYVQAILAGHNPLRPADRALLNESLADMVSLSTNLMKANISVADFLPDDPESTN